MFPLIHLDSVVGKIMRIPRNRGMSELLLALAVHRERLVPESKREELSPCEVEFYDYAGTLASSWPWRDRHLITIPAGLELFCCLAFDSRFHKIGVVKDRCR